jgi:phosphoserine phosphatase RsbU/P
MLPPAANAVPTSLTWQSRLAAIVNTMREMSLQTQPQEMVRMYVQRMQEMLPVDRRISLSRRGLDAPRFRITRYSGWDQEINPWKSPEQLPELSGGMLAELLYANQPQILNDFHVPADDPAYEYLAGQRSLTAIPLFDQGVALNMVVVTREDPNSFPYDDLPDRVWMANLFGRATHNLVLAEELQAAYQQVERELRVVAEIQRSLLPAELPNIATLDLAAHYQTSRQAGGDYYDFFPLSGGRWGVLIADVSGHGTPAAVVMAITHCIAHLHCDDNHNPAELLKFLNEHLTARYTTSSGHFVTAFYGVYDPSTRRLTYSSAGHNPPRLRHCGDNRVIPLDQATQLPLGFVPELEYRTATQQLFRGDRLVLYTDGITEAAHHRGELFGTERLDQVLGNCSLDAREALSQVLAAVEGFTDAADATDDRTLVIMDVT